MSSLNQIIKGCTPKRVMAPIPGLHSCWNWNVKAQNAMISFQNLCNLSAFLDSCNFSYGNQNLKCPLWNFKMDFFKVWSSSGDFCDCPHVQRHVTLKCMVMSSQGNQAFNVLREQVDRRKLSVIVHNSHQKTSAILDAFFNIFRNAETTICKCYCVIIECSMAWWGPHKVTCTLLPWEHINGSSW